MYQKFNKSFGQYKDENVVKIAVQFEGFSAQLIEFDKRKSLDEIIGILCNFSEWDIKKANNYGLKFHDATVYVTEDNRHSVKNGDVLILTHSAVKVANDIYKTLERGLPEDQTACLKMLNNQAKDIALAKEFIQIHGIDLLIAYINADKYNDETVAYLLSAFVELMEHGFVPWQMAEFPIHARIIRYLSSLHSQEILQPAIEILDNIVQNSANPESIDIKFEALLRVLEVSRTNEFLQQTTIALINKLFQVANEHRKIQIAHDFGTKEFRDVLNSSVFKNTMGTELRYQLYVLQTSLLNLYNKRIMTTIDDSTDSTNKIRELKQIAFRESSVSEPDGMKRPIKAQSKIQRKLGFKSEINIEESFTRSPPGVLPLDCLVYFAQNYRAVYKNIVAEINSTTEEYEFPLGEAAVELVKLMCEVLRIGEPPSEQAETFYPMLFSHNQPLYEFFCICIEIMNCTWTDMKATRNDFIKVVSVAKEQIIRTLGGQPLTLNDFKRNIKTYTYTKIAKLREEERASREEYESTASTIVELKQKLTPHILKIIKKQRLDFLVEGSRFHHCGKPGQRMKDKYWYARLSTNHKTLHYGNCDEEATPPIEELSTQINVNDIQELYFGPDYPIKKKGQTVLKCLFAISYLDQSSQPCDEPLEFLAMNELTQNYWVDGLSILKDLDMPSARKIEDLDTLLSMEIKLRLLDTDGFEIQNAPLIPPDPEDYDF